MSASSPTALQLAGGSGDGGDGSSYMLQRADLGLYAVASPVGPTGRAATFALEAIAANLPQPLGVDATGQVRGVILDAQARWKSVVEKDPSCRGLGACLAAVAVQTTGVVVAHLGDCGVLQLRGREIVARTTDHTMPTLPSKSFPAGRVIVRGFGMDSEPEVQWWPTEAGDRLLLLSEVRTRIADDEIADVAAKPASLPSLVRMLLERALERGATGECSVLVVVARRAGSA